MKFSVVQVIDTLEAGGAERVAVNIANWLAQNGHRSYLCVTRRGGPLETEIDSRVQVIRLNRRGRFDGKAVIRFARFIFREKIDIIHAHSTSLFLAIIAVKIALRGKLIWHDHYGAFGVNARSVLLYRCAIQFARAVIVVNHELEKWARNELEVSPHRIHYMQNFFVQPPMPSLNMFLPGEIGKRVLLVGNLRPQKDHPNFLKSIKLVLQEEPEAQFFIVGGYNDKNYFAALQSMANELEITNNVHWLGQRNDVRDLLRHFEIGVLSSASEGFPLTLLEYGDAGLAVVATNTGQCAEILDGGQAGILVPPGDAPELAAGILRLLRDRSLRGKLGDRLKQFVDENYHIDVVIPRLVRIYSEILCQDSTVRQ